MKYLYVIILIICNSYISFAQCSCMGGASVGGISQLVGSANVGLMNSEQLRVLTFYSNTYGDTYYSGDTKTIKGTVQDFRNSNLNLNIAYGISNDFTAEAELSYYLEKAQTFSTYTLSANGLAHLNLMLKYNMLKMNQANFDWTLGVGVRIPFPFDDNQPVHLRPSTGAFGFAMQSYLHKGFKSSATNIILANRIEYNLQNTDEFQYGASFTNSLYVVQSIVEQLSGVVEFRSDYRIKDKTHGEQINNSGGHYVVISPQINYSFSDFGIAAIYDIPLYKNYNGSQLTTSYTFGIALSWQVGL